MKIGIDVSMVDNKRAGIGSYANSLVIAFAQIDNENQYFLFTHNKLLLDGLVLPANFEVVEVLGSGNLKWMVNCMSKIWSLKLDQFLSPSNLN